MLKKLLIAGVVAALLVLYVVFDLGQYVTVENLRAQRDALVAEVRERPLRIGGAFFAAYVLATALSLPVAGILTLAAGAIFGFWWGVAIVSFASSIGATLAFLVSRYLFRDSLRRRFGERLRRIDEGVRREGGFYLFTLRLIPAFPFWLINLGMGLTALRTWTFYWVSQTGMLAGTAVYVNAGTQLGEVRSLADILSPALIGSFILLGLFPLLAKKGLDSYSSRRALRAYRAPARTDYNVIVIGAGSGGLVSAYIAAAVKSRVALVEKEKMGGDCLNTGCVPSKTLIRSARFFHDVARGETFGAREPRAEVDFAAVMDRVHRAIRTIEPHDSVERYRSLGVDCHLGSARILDPYTVEVDGKRLTTRNIVLATGAQPFVPPIPGVEAIEALTSANLWKLRTLPRRLAVIGGGPIGCEMAQAFRRFGAEVVQIEAGDRILSKEDPDISAMLLQRFRDEGIDVRTGHEVARFSRDGDVCVAHCEVAGGEVEIRCDRVLMALGRKPTVSGYGLEELGVRVAERGGTVETDGFLRSNYPNIFAVGDVAGPYQFTHFAAHQAWYAAVNALFAPFVRFKADDSVIPWCTYTDPEIAHVGLSEEDARRKGTPFQVVRYDLKGQDRAIAEGDAYGVVKVLTPPGKDRILGATIVGPHAGELLAEMTLAMKHELGLKKILGTVHAYPTLAEANKSAAGQWRLANKPERALRWLERYHGWRRSRRASRLLFSGLAVTTAVLLALIAGAWQLATAKGTPPRVGEAPPAESGEVRELWDGSRVVTEPATDAYAELLAAVADEDGWVDYGLLRREHADELQRYLDSIAYLDPATYAEWDRDRRFAFWINAYNALTLGVILANWPVERTLTGLVQSLAAEVPSPSIRNIPGVWTELRFPVMGKELTLDEIEHEILRPRFGDGRLHAAINCASVGCPPLSDEPFRGDELDRQLDAQMRWFLLEKPETRVRIDREARRVTLSPIFDWFGEDFAAEGETVRQGVLRTVARYLDPEDASWLRTNMPDVEVAYHAYDWGLNDARLRAR